MKKIKHHRLPEAFERVKKEKKGSKSGCLTKRDKE